MYRGRKLGIFAVIVGLAGLLSANGHAGTAQNRSSVERAYTTALRKPDAKLQTTFIPLKPDSQAMALYRQHKAKNRNPSVVVLKGKSAAAKKTFAILADTDRFGLIAVFNRTSQQPITKGSVYIGPKSSEKSKVNWFHGASNAAPSAGPAPAAD